MPSDADLEDGMEGKKAGSPLRIFTLARPEWPWLGVGLVSAQTTYPVDNQAIADHADVVIANK